jgi:hypothetical protein
MEETNPKTFVFVLIPFSDDFADIYELGIKPACKDAGAYCEKVDEQIFVDSILERIYNQIAKADVIVSDMTSRNPNVFYETGYAHALNKRVILLTQNADDIPFDLKHYPHIVYGRRIALLKSQLEARIRWCIENPKESLTKAELDLQFYIDSIPVDNSPELAFDKGGRVTFDLDIHNSTGRVLSPSSFKIALIIPCQVTFFYPEIVSTSILPDRKYIHNLEQPHTLFPDDWGSIKIQFNTQGQDDKEIRLTHELAEAVKAGLTDEIAWKMLKGRGVINDRVINFAEFSLHDELKQREDLSWQVFIRLFTELGCKDYPLTIRYAHSSYFPEKIDKKRPKKTVKGLKGKDQ